MGNAYQNGILTWGTTSRVEMEGQVQYYTGCILGVLEAYVDM